MSAKKAVSSSASETTETARCPPWATTARALWAHLWIYSGPAQSLPESAEPSPSSLPAFPRRGCCEIMRNSLHRRIHPAPDTSRRHKLNIQSCSRRSRASREALSPFIAFSTRASLRSSVCIADQQIPVIGCQAIHVDDTHQ